MLHQNSGKKKLSRGWKQQVPLKRGFISKGYNSTHPRMDVHTVSGTATTTKSRQQSALGDVREHVEDEGTVFFGGMYYCSRTS
jgi:hypothetical protein